MEESNTHCRGGCGFIGNKKDMLYVLKGKSTRRTQYWFCIDCFKKNSKQETLKNTVRNFNKTAK